MYFKEYCYRTSSGTESIVFALKELDSKVVMVPTWTCSSLIRAIEKVGGRYLIVDSDFDLQIDVNAAIENAHKCDTVIIPHMCGGRANVKEIREKTNLKIIEDVSQCHGLSDLGKYSDVVVSSTAKSKWVDLKKGGLLFSNKFHDVFPFDFNSLKPTIQKNLERRQTIASEIKEAGVNLIGNESSYLRGMYFTNGKSARKLYEPLHRIYNKGYCPKAEDFSDYVNWISIFV